MGDQAVVDFDRGRFVLSAEVQRHFHLQFGVGLDPLEIDVQHKLLEGVHLHIPQ